MGPDARRCVPDRQGGRRSGQIDPWSLVRSLGQSWERVRPRSRRRINRPRRVDGSDDEHESFERRETEPPWLSRLAASRRRGLPDIMPDVSDARKECRSSGGLVPTQGSGSPPTGAAEPRRTVRAPAPLVRPSPPGSGATLPRSRRAARSPARPGSGPGWPASRGRPRSSGVETPAPGSCPSPG